MKKRKIFGLIIAATLAIGLVACGEKIEDSKEAKSSASQQSRTVGENEKTKDLTGAWAEKEFTHKSFNEEGDKIIEEIHTLCRHYGLEYKDEEKLEQIDGVKANVKLVYLDNLNPEDNKLESMQFSRELLGESQEGGKYKLKMSLKFNGQKAIDEGNFNFGDTSLAKYAAIITGEENRDYSEINQKIIEIIKSDKPEGVVEDNVNGLYEEIAVSKEYIVYTLETKEYNFIQENNVGL